MGGEPEWRRSPQLPSPERVVVWIAAGMGGIAVLLTALLGLVAVVERGWIGPAARVSGALVAGVALWVTGAAARRRWPWAASALSGGGIGTLYGALYAASGFYHLLPNSLASAGMIAVTTVATFRAARQGDRFVAWLALIGGMLTPVLVSTGSNRPYQLFAYLGLLGLGVVLPASRRGWWDLVLGAALASGLLHLGWTGSWRAADQLLPALLGLSILGLPQALASSSADRAVRWAGAVGAAGLGLLALPWLVPVDATFYDPRTGQEVVRSASGALGLTVTALALLPLPSLLVARWRGTWAPALAGAALVTLLPGVAVTGWGALAEPNPAGLAALTLVGLAVATVLALGHRRTSATLGLAPLTAGLALAGAAGGMTGAALGTSVLALATLAAVLTRSSGSAWLFATGLAGTALAALGGQGREALAPGFLVGPVLVALFAFSHLPVRWRRMDDETVGHLTAAAAGLLLFPALYDAWNEQLSGVMIGLLPLLLAGNALLAGAALARSRSLPRDDLRVAVFAGVVLLGLSAAVPLQLEQRWLTVAWALEAAALAGAARQWRLHPLTRWVSLALCAAVGVRLLFNPWALAWGDAGAGWPILNWTLYTWGVPAICLLLCARWLPEPQKPGDPLALFTLPLGILATLVGFALVNVEVSHAFQDAGPIELGGSGRTQAMVRSAAWAGYGLAVLGAGLWRDHRVVRLVGFGFVMLATVKVFLLDLWGLTGFLRVGSIGSLAVALLVAAFVFERLVLRGSRPVEES